jgi:hypothetical protein
MCKLVKVISLFRLSVSRGKIDLGIGTKKTVHWRNDGEDIGEVPESTVARN